MIATLPSTIAQLRRRIMDGDLTVANAVQAQEQLTRMNDWNSVVHDFGPADKLAEPALPLAGVGLAHKDIFVMPAWRPKCGAKVAPSFNEPVNPVIHRLHGAGTRTLATLAMAEYASGITAESQQGPVPINPLDPRYVVGGSSSGSAVAVATGLCYGSLATDTAGSVRVPAATCGVFALKPTHGVLETRGCFPLAPSLDTVGLITRSALDAAVLFALGMEASTCEAIMPGLAKAIHVSGGVLNEQHLPAQPLRLATVYDHHNGRFSADEPVRDGLATFAAEFSSAPVVHHDQLHSMVDLIRNASIVLHVEAATTHYSRLRADTTLSASTRNVALPGAAIPAVWYCDAMRNKQSLLQQFVHRYLTESDVLLSPVLPHGIPDQRRVHTQSEDFHPLSLLALLSWTAFINYLGLPAVVFPIGHDSQGAPICVQAIGRPYSDGALLALAWHAEQRRYGSGGFVACPPLLRAHVS